MGLHAGFKSECLKSFPEAWNIPPDVSHDTLHVFDGMCLLHSFSPNPSLPVNGMDQLVSFFHEIMQAQTCTFHQPTTALVFDITSHLPSTKSEELEKRTSEKPAIVEPADLSVGFLPSPWEACLADRESRMLVCSELLKRLMALGEAGDPQKLVTYGLVDDKVIFCYADRRPVVPDNELLVFGEADISIFYVIKELRKPTVLVHTVDTDLVAISLVEDFEFQPRVSIRLSHYDQTEKKRVFNTVDVNIMKHSLRTRYNMSPDAFVVLCILQGTDFVERNIARGSWKTLFQAMNGCLGDTVSLKEDRVEIRPKGILEFLIKVSPKTVSASDKAGKRRKLQARDVTIEDTALLRVAWQYFYWKRTPSVGYDTLRKCVGNGWVPKEGNVTSKKNGTALNIDTAPHSLALFLDGPTSKC